MRFRAIPQIPNADAETRAFLAALKENFEILAGQRGDGSFVLDQLGFIPQEALGFIPQEALGFIPQEALGFIPANKAGDRIDGNLILGTATQPAWPSSTRVLEGCNGVVMFYDGTGGTYIAGNCYWDGTNWRYKTTGAATLLAVAGLSGTITASTAASGAADAVISWVAGTSIDTAGRVTLPNQPTFSARITGGGGFVALADTGGWVPWPVGSGAWAALTNVGSNYSTTTGRFTAPVAGTYLFSAQNLFNISVNYAEIGLGVNGVLTGVQEYAAPGINAVSVHSELTLAAGDYVNPVYLAPAGVIGSIYGAKYSSFSGHLIG